MQALDVLQDAPLVFEGGVFAGVDPGALDLLALERPEIKQPQLLLFGALQVLPPSRELLTTTPDTNVVRLNTMFE